MPLHPACYGRCGEITSILHIDLDTQAIPDALSLVENITQSVSPELLPETQPHTSASTTKVPPLATRKARSKISKLNWTKSLNADNPID